MSLSSLMRFSDPFRRKMPSTPVAVSRHQNHVSNRICMRDVAPTFLLQEHTAFCHHYWNIAIYVALAVVVDERNGDIRVDNALSQWHTEDAL